MTVTLIETPGQQAFRATLHEDGVLEINDTRQGWYGWKFEAAHGSILRLMDRNNDITGVMITKDQRTVFMDPRGISGENRWVFNTDMMACVVTLDVGLDTEVSYFMSRGTPGLEVFYGG